MDKDQSFDKLLQQTMSPGEKPGAADPCLDAETLAAWGGNLLSASERASAEMHLAECDRCLAVLAAIAKTDPPSSTAPSSRWISVRWLVPAATAAMGVAAWVLVHQPQPPASAGRDRDAAPQAAVAGTPAPVDALHDAAPAPAPPLPQRPNQQLQARAASDSLRKDTAADQPAAKAAAPAAEALPAPPPPAAVTAGSPPVPAAAPASPSPARNEAAETRPFAGAREKKDERSVIRSADISVQWRIDGSAVERSIDNGRTWQAQATGTTADLLAGASPAPTVCWIVGRKGTVLLTTDGESWRQVPFPEPGIDLVSVSARNDTEAAVTTAGGRVYRTTDGGRTWTLQGNPAAPF
jgi:hypothetical protein